MQQGTWRGRDELGIFRILNCNSVHYKFSNDLSENNSYRAVLKQINGKFAIFHYEIWIREHKFRLD